MTIMSTQLESTSILDNHQPQDCDMSEGDDQDDTHSSYKPSPETTKGCNSDNQTYCDSPLCGESPISPPLLSLPPLYPESPLFGETPLWPASSVIEVYFSHFWTFSTFGIFAFFLLLFRYVLCILCPNSCLFPCAF